MEKPTVRDKPTVTVAACDFGWGSVGKLRLILDELNCIFEDRIAIFAEPQSFDLLSRIMPGRVEKRRIDGQRVDLGLVINDPRHADELSDSGVPVIYVDSLPYLWTLQDEVPRVVEVYCAQRYPGHGSQLKNGPLEHRPDVVWIDPIVPCPRIRTARGGVVINVGGLHSHLAQQSVGAYQEVVVLPLVRMLVSGGHQISAICGNLDHRIVRELRSLVPAGTTVGIHTGDEFEEVLVDASLLLTSPDFRGSNLLARGLKLSGVLDWSDARRASREADLGGVDWPRFRRVLGGYLTVCPDVRGAELLGYFVGRHAALAEAGVIGRHSALRVIDLCAQELTGRRLLDMGSAYR
jgi:hypothetical protein